MHNIAHSEPRHGCAYVKHPRDSISRRNNLFLWWTPEFGVVEWGLIYLVSVDVYQLHRLEVRICKEEFIPKCESLPDKRTFPRHTHTP